MSTNENNRIPELELCLEENEKTSKKQRRCVKFCDNFSDYSENTTIHGIKYLGERRRPLAEKIWWVIGFLICVACLGYFIYIVVEKWQKTPVIVTRDETKTLIYKVPFPAVTICPETKMKSQLFTYSETLHKLKPQYLESPENDRATNSSVKYFESMSHICELLHFESTEQSLWKGKQFMDKSYVHAIQELAPNYDELFLGCIYNYEFGCDTLLTPIITEEGQCYTFNIITDIFRDSVMQDDYRYFNANRPAKNWDFDAGYTSDAIEDAHPKRAMAMGKLHGVTLFLKNYDDDMNFLCRSGDQGYKITLHNPTEYPQPNKHFVRVPHGDYAQFVVTPQITKTASSLNSYSPQRRQCFFNHERYLKYFRVYNQMNCMLECIANATYTECGCIKFSLPRGRDIPICGVDKIKCYVPIWNEWENNVLLKQFEEEYHGNNKSSTMRSADKCNCLPECTMVRYETDHEIIKFDFKQGLEELDPDILKNIEGNSNRSYTITKIDVHFAQTNFYGETRSELYGISDLVANFGGLLGLFMGGSILSLVELIYFCTIRNLCNARRTSSNTPFDVV